MNHSENPSLGNSVEYLSGSSRVLIRASGKDHSLNTRSVFSATDEEEQAKRTCWLTLKRYKGKAVKPMTTGVPSSYFNKEFIEEMRQLAKWQS